MPWSVHKHRIDVDIAEGLLRRAVTELNSAHDADSRSTHGKRVRIQAEHVLSARHRLLRSRLRIAEDSLVLGDDASSARIAKLKKEIDDLERGGVVAVLDEFEAGGV